MKLQFGKVVLFTHPFIIFENITFFIHKIQFFTALCTVIRKRSDTKMRFTLNTKCLFFIASLLIIFSISSLIYISFHIHHHEEITEQPSISTLENKKKKVVIINSVSDLIDEVLLKSENDSSMRKCTFKTDASLNITENRKCIDSRGNVCSCFSILSDNNNNNCCPASSSPSKQEEFREEVSSSFSFSSYSDCVSTCLNPVHDERRVDNFIKLQYTKRYKNMIKKIIKRLTAKLNSEKTERRSFKIPDRIYLSRNDVMKLMMAGNNNNNNHLGLWLCGEQCRFDNQESIYFETRFKEGGPVYKF